MSDGRELKGQQYQPRFNFLAPFTEQVKDYGITEPAATGSEGNAATEIIPIDRGAARVRTFDQAAIGATLAAKVYKFPSYRNIQIPDVLTGVVVDYNTSTGDGETTFPIEDQIAVAVGSGSVSINPRANAQASASIMPVITPEITSYNGNNVPVNVYMFFLAEGATSQAQILTRLAQADLANATVNAWPKFKPQEVLMVLKGQQLSLSTNANTSARLSWSDNSASGERVKGSGYSTEVGVTTRRETIPATIHGTFTVSNVAMEETVTSKADASSIAIWSTVGTVAGTVNKQEKTGKVYASVSPSTIPTTGGVTAIPTSGLYLVDVSVEPSSLHGYSMITAEVFDFSYYA